jgi:hypothetical protein
LSELLKKLFLLNGKDFRYSDAYFRVQIPSAAPGIWEALAFEPDLAT